MLRHLIPLVLAGAACAQQEPEELHRQVLATLRQRIELAERTAGEHGKLLETARAAAEAGRMPSSGLHDFHDAHLRSRARVLELRQERQRTAARLGGEEEDLRAVIALIERREELAEERIRSWEGHLQGLENLYRAGRASEADLLRARNAIAAIRDHALKLRQQALELELQAVRDEQKESR